ncbi:hypothetical protein ACJMK2_008822 [Sinanodonta woodiana]
MAAFRELYITSFLVLVSQISGQWWSGNATIKHCGSSDLTIAFNFSLSGENFYSRSWGLNSSTNIIAEANSTGILTVQPPYISRLTLSGMNGITLSRVNSSDSGRYLFHIITDTSYKLMTATTTVIINEIPNISCIPITQNYINSITCKIPNVCPGRDSLQPRWNDGSISWLKCPITITKYSCCAVGDPVTNCYNGSLCIETECKDGSDPGSIRLSPNRTSHELTESSSLTVNCSADCFPDCKYTWTGPSGNIVSSSGLLFFMSIGRNQSGQYTCTASDSDIPIKRATSTISVTVFYGPDDRKVSLSPSNTSYQLTELSRLDVKCSATCVPQCDYQWSGPLVSQNNNMGLLSISQIQRNQNGTFICTVTNPKIPGKSATANFYVIVYYGPDTNGLTLSPSNTSYQLTESSSFTVQCTATCEPQCNYQWIGPGTSQNDNHGLLSVSEISRNQSGIFTCTVTNPKNPGKSVIANISVIVYYALDVLVSYSGSMNSTVLLTCIASGEPSQYRFQEWIHKIGATEIRTLTGENTATTSTLTLPNISIEDMGTYVCTVDISITGQNGQIEQTGQTDIFVHGTIFKENTNTMFIGMINKSATIEIPFYSSPSSTTVHFYKGANTVEVTNTSDTLIYLSSSRNIFTFYGKEVLLMGQSAVLHFRMVKLTDYGEYTADLLNNIGSTSRRIVFSSGKPDTPANFHITDIQEKQVTLQWLYGYHKGFDQTFVVQISMDNITWTNASIINAGKEEGWFSATITGLKSNTLYYFRLYSFNVNGESDLADVKFATRTCKESAYLLDIGASIGIGFGGLFLGVIGTIFVIIIIRKRITTPPKFSSTREADISTDMQTYANTGVSPSPAPSHYEELQQDHMEKTMYDRI